MPHNNNEKNGAFFRDIHIDRRMGTEDGYMKINMWNKLVGREKLESFPAWKEATDSACQGKLMTYKHGRGKDL